MYSKNNKLGSDAASEFRAAMRQRNINRPPPRQRQRTEPALSSQNALLEILVEADQWISSLSNLTTRLHGSDEGAYFSDAGGGQGDMQGVSETAGESSAVAEEDRGPVIPKILTRGQYLRNLVLVESSVLQKWVRKRMMNVLKLLHPDKAVAKMQKNGRDPAAIERVKEEAHKITRHATQVLENFPKALRDEGRRWGCGGSVLFSKEDGANCSCLVEGGGVRRAGEGQECRWGGAEWMGSRGVVEVARRSDGHQFAQNGNSHHPQFS